MRMQQGSERKQKECEFVGSYGERILEHIIRSIDDKKLIEKAISKTWTRQTDAETRRQKPGRGKTKKLLRRQLNMLNLLVQTMTSLAWQLNMSDVS